MNQFIQLQANLFITILLIVTVIHSYINLDLKNKIESKFVLVTLIVLILIVFESLSVIINNQVFVHLRTLHILINVIGFSLCGIPPLLIFYIINEWINPNFQPRKTTLILISIPSLILIIVSLLNIKYNIIFNISSSNIYNRGPYFIISPLVTYFYFILIVYTLLKSIHKIKWNELFVFSVCILIPFVLGYIQLRYRDILTIWNSCGISLLIIYLTIMNNKSTKDALTGVGNRLGFQNLVDRYSKNIDENLAVITIDLDNLKSINDTYGHYEGDKAIVAFSKKLKLLFARKCNIFRIGGDEFIIFISEYHNENIIGLLDQLEEHLRIYSNENKKTYRIAFSYGIAYYKENSTIEMMIRKSDALMYQNKTKKKLLLEKAYENRRINA